MVIARIAVSAFYAGLMAFAVFAHYDKFGRLDILMLLGSLALLIVNFFCMFYVTAVHIAIAAAALILMHIAALYNGKRSGKINPAHHLVRLAVSAVIVTLFVLSKN